MENCLKSKLAPKLERKYVEKNRRNHMKNLCNQLHSMLPTTHASTSKETTKAVPDQIDAAVNYIESLKVKLEKSKKHLEELIMGQKKAQSLNQTNEPGPITNSPAQIEFHEMGPNMVVVLINGLYNIATFNNIIRLCHKEGVEVVCTNFKLNGNSTLQISHETKVQINRSSTMEFSATTLCDKMKELIYGNDVDSQLHLWDYKIEFDALELLPTRSQNQNMYIYMQNEYEIPTFF
ncbi:transcription factor bHLH162-like [Solanum stenotomum]|uniref:transcription factor bHLH162-like n=1 Tax=Solanum stenotomum TaxID=172797 RepID=UPI0020D18B53|nr:transcription factor bHLH162-like [Solanum stenotomum]